MTIYFPIRWTEMDCRNWLGRRGYNQNGLEPWQWGMPAYVCWVTEHIEPVSWLWQEHPLDVVLSDAFLAGVEWQGRVRITTAGQDTRGVVILPQ